MKVIHAFKDYYPPTRGGIEEHMNEVVHSLRGFRFGVLTSSRTRNLVVDDDEGVRVVRAPELARVASTPITPSWVKLLKESQADLIHMHMPNPFGEIAFLMSRTKSPMVATYHADIVGRAALLPAYRPFQAMFLKKAYRVIVSNPRTIETSTALEPIRDRCVVIPFGVEPGDWSEPPDSADGIREKFPGPIIVFLGRLAYYKGVDVLINAMRSIEATCLIIGDGPIRSSLESMTSDLRLRHKVVFTGEVSDDERTAFLHAADIFVLPSTSRAEAFGIAMLQAMACGKPVVSTELGTGTSWVNVNNRTGIVVPPGEPPALAGAIKAILGDRVKREDLGLAAAERVRTNFTRFQMLESLASLYASV